MKTEHRVALWAAIEYYVRDRERGASRELLADDRQRIERIVEIIATAAARDELVALSERRRSA